MTGPSKQRVLERLFGGKALIGMVHLPALPGSPGFRGSIADIYRRAVADATALADAGFDAVLVENYGDHPYRNGAVDRLQLAVLAGVTRDVVRELERRFGERAPLVGVNVQFNAFTEELAIAKACGAQFLRAEVFVEYVLTEDGPVEPSAARLVRLNREWAGPEIVVLADVHSKGTRPVVNMELEDAARWAERAGADAVIVTGAATGVATPLESVRRVRTAVRVPVLVGSGVTEDTVAATLGLADGVIVGSAVKEDGRAENPVSPARARAFVRSARAGLASAS